MENSSVEKPTVLYVDDIKANLMLFEASFDADYHVLLAESGNEALKVLEDADVHVIVSDQNMPGMTGNELLERITIDYPDIMRFMITAYTDYETVVEAINKGHLYGFFNKPYNVEDVKLSINKSLEVRSLRIYNREIIQKLEKANEALLGIDRSKTNFLISVTDEIRTPINKIMTAVHMIKDKIDSQELTELLSLLDVSVGRLENFSSAAQQLVRLNDSEFNLNKEEVSFKELIEVAIIEKGNWLNDRGVRVLYNSDDALSPIHAEYELLLTCFSYIIEYLAGHSASGTELNCKVEDNYKGLGIHISSENSSYQKGEMESLMVFFSDNNNGVTQDVSVELLLVKEIVAVHKGEIVFNTEGAKSSFELLFPLEIENLS